MDDRSHDRRSYDLEVAEIRRDISELQTEISELRADIKGLVEAWNTAKGMTSFVKWLSGLIIAFGVVAALFRGLLK